MLIVLAGCRPSVAKTVECWLLGERHYEYEMRTLKYYKQAIFSATDLCTDYVTAEYEECY